MTIPKKTALLPIALVAIFTGTMISTPIAGMIPWVNAQGPQGPPPTQGACPEPNYKFNPGADRVPGFCVDGDPCPAGTTGVINGICVDGDACKSPDKFNPATGKCDDGPACDKPDVFNTPVSEKCNDGPACISPAVLVGDKCVTTEDNKCPPGYTPTGTGQGICVVAPKCPPGYKATAGTTDQGLCVTDPVCPTGFGGVNSDGKCTAPVSITNCPSAAPSTNPIVLVGNPPKCAVKPGDLQNP